MDLDKHDLFRNASPGFVFLLVLISFLFVAGETEKIKTAPEAALALLSGFPMGFLIQSLYRLWHNNCERKEIDELENGLAEQLFESGHSDMRLYQAEREKGHFLWHMISRSENKDWKDRIDFQYSMMHSLGAVWTSILLALALVFIFCHDELIVCPCSPLFALASVWLFVGALIFFGVRPNAKENAWLSSKILIYEEHDLGSSKKPCRCNTHTGPRPAEAR